MGEIWGARRMKKKGGSGKKLPCGPKVPREKGKGTERGEPPPTGKRLTHYLTTKSIWKLRKKRGPKVRGANYRGTPCPGTTNEKGGLPRGDPLPARTTMGATAARKGEVQSSRKFLSEKWRWLNTRSLSPLNHQRKRTHQGPQGKTRDHGR